MTDGRQLRLQKNIKATLDGGKRLQTMFGIILN